MADKWLVDASYPAGRLVAMTPAEEVQLGEDRAASAAVAAARAAADARAETRISGLRKARADLASGRIFASLSASERDVIDMLLA